MARSKSFGWAIFASVVVVAAMVLKERSAHHAIPATSSVVMARQLGYVVSLVSTKPIISAMEAAEIAARRHDGVRLSTQALSSAELVWWGKRSPHLAWLMVGHPVQSSRRADWLVVINARSGAWMLERVVAQSIG